MPEDSHSYCKFQIHRGSHGGTYGAYFHKKWLLVGGLQQLGYHPNYTTNLIHPAFTSLRSR